MAFIVFLCSWTILKTISIFPDFLPYFNEIAGGPDKGIHYLDDSNIDWGQDLYKLKRYIEKNDPGNVVMYPFSSVDPGFYGISYEKIEIRDIYWPRTDCTYFISAEYLQRNSISRRFRGLRFHWLEKYKPVDKIGWSIFVYRFSTDPAMKNSGRVFYLIKIKWYNDAINAFSRILERWPEFSDAGIFLKEALSEKERWLNRGTPED
jgi:hypothetical protein